MYNQQSVKFYHTSENFKFDYFKWNSIFWNDSKNKIHCDKYLLKSEFAIFAEIKEYERALY